MKIAVIIGSTRPGRAGKDVADWYLSQAEGKSDLEFDVIDLADVNLPFLDEVMPPAMGQYQNQHTKDWAEKIAGYDGYVWVTSEYNHAPPASLLNAISFLFAEWNRKPVAFVGYGNMGGARAIEQLRMVAGELEMADIRLAIGIRSPWAMKDDDGNIKPELVYNDVGEQVKQLEWWTKTLKAAR